MWKFSFLLLFSLSILNSFINAQNSSSSLADPVIVNDVAFIKLGTYRGFTEEGSEYQKTYFFSRYSSGSWADSRSFCHSYGLEFLTMDTLAEGRAVLTMADNNSILRTFTSVWLNIDGIALTLKSPTNWYWTNSGKKISYPIPWRPDAPNNHGGSEYCLTIGRYLTTGKFGFDDALCNNNDRISCQRIDFFIAFTEK